jgi:hypothetical protein
MGCVVPILLIICFEAKPHIIRFLLSINNALYIHLDLVYMNQGFLQQNILLFIYHYLEEEAKNISSSLAISKVYF